MSLKRHAGVVAACAGYRWLMGLGFGLPVALSVASVTGEHPQSDAVLWQPGGVWLLETARQLGGRLVADTLAGLVAMLALAFGWLLFLAALIAHVGDRRRPASELMRRAADRFAPLTLLMGITWVGQAIALVGAVWLGRHFATPDPSGDQLRLVVLAGGLLLTGLMAIGHDAARVVCVQERPGAWDLVNRTFELLFIRPRGLLVAALWRAGVAWIALLAAAGAASTMLAGEGLGLLSALVLQGVAIGCFVALRASWFTWLTEARRSLPPLRGFD